MNRSETPPHAPRRCDHCGHPAEVVVVHGHGQCTVCGTNVEPCCQGGETCPPPPARPER
ncbi:MAG: hypothetical protein ACYTGJ_05270 [Planctomycetota bacterium]